MLATYRIAAVLVALHAVVAAAAADDAYTIVTHWNAVPSGTSFDIDVLTGCADKCVLPHQIATNGLGTMGTCRGTIALSALRWCGEVW